MNKTMHGEKKLAHLLFDFAVINSTDNECEQQVRTIALCLQHC